MLDDSQHKLVTQELGPDLSSIPVWTRTNWHVITGASCSGKTTLIDQLADMGFQTVPEVGRGYFEAELAKGRTIDEIRGNRVTLTCRLYDMWLQVASGLRTSEVLFLDRGLPDALTFYRFAGMNPNDIWLDCFKHRYASVFLLNRLPYRQDGVRVGDDATASYFESWISRDYAALGYKVVRVPVMSPEARLAFVLDRLSEQGLLPPQDD